VGQIKLTGKLSPSAFIQRAYDDLPINYEGAETEYYQFAKSFGTHYRVSAKMGGIMSIFHKFGKQEESNSQKKQNQELFHQCATTKDTSLTVVFLMN